MTPQLFPPNLDEQCDAAMARVLEWIHRSVGQHIRRMREAWGQS